MPIRILNLFTRNGGQPHAEEEQPLEPQGQGRRNSDSSQTSQASQASGATPRVRGSSGFSFRVAWRSLQSFVTRWLPGGEPRSYNLVPRGSTSSSNGGGNQLGPNAMLLWEVKEGKHPEYHGALGEAGEEAKASCQAMGMPHGGGEMIVLRDLALTNLQKIDKKDLLKPEELKALLAQEMVNIKVSRQASVDVKAALAAQQVTVDEGALADLLRAHSLLIKDVGAAPDPEKPGKYQHLVKVVENKAHTLHDYTQAKNEAKARAVDVLVAGGMPPDDVNNSTEMKIFMTKIEQTALKIEEQAKEANGGDMPHIPKAAYAAAFMGIAVE